MMLTVVLFIYDAGLLISVFKLVINQRFIHTNRLISATLQLCSAFYLFIVRINNRRDLCAAV